jgi:hypothetical protein
MWVKSFRTFGTYQVHYLGFGENKWVWSYANKFYISAQVGVPYKLGSGTIYPSGHVYQTTDVYATQYGYLWSNLYITQCVRFSNLEFTTYSSAGVASEGGNVWYSKSDATSPVGTYVPRGLRKSANTSKVVTATPILGWTSNDLYGVYSPVTDSGVTGQLYLGVAQFNSAVGVFTQSLVLFNGLTKCVAPGYFWWGNYISHVLGTINPEVGYWLRDGSIYRLQYTGGGTRPTPETITPIFWRFVEGSETTPIHEAQIGVWI